MERYQHLLPIHSDGSLPMAEKVIGYTMNLTIAIESERSGTAFGETTVRVPNEYLVAKTRLSANLARRAMAGMVGRGYFVRLDNGQGGPGNPGVYQAALPADSPVFTDDPFLPKRRR